MEKRNFVTSVRTVDNDEDMTIKEASCLFSNTEKRDKQDSFEKKASSEDEKSDLSR